VIEQVLTFFYVCDSCKAETADTRRVHLGAESPQYPYPEGWKVEARLRKAYRNTKPHERGGFAYYNHHLCPVCASKPASENESVAEDT
jgi:hypothetical protein